MAIHIKDITGITWAWHDASLIAIEALWLGDGSSLVRLKCKINPEEEEGKESLSAMGIESLQIEAQFRNATEYTIRNPGDFSSGEVIIRWRVTGVSPEVVSQHHIECSGGTNIDIICEQVWLEEIRD